MRTWRWYSKVLFALLVAAFAYWVWPTPWRWEETNTGLYRLNRFTGRVERMGLQGDWHDPKNDGN